MPPIDQFETICNPGLDIAARLQGKSGFASPCHPRHNMAHSRGSQSQVMSEQLTPEHFLPYVDRVFAISGWPYPLVLEQVDIGAMQEWEKARLARQPFNLIFRGPPGHVLPEGLYSLAVEQGPAFDLYVIPIHTMERDRQNYQALFN
jgi:Domain of unknown function (DUF6916)